MRALRSEGAIAEAHHVAPRVHRLLNTVPRQIQLGSFSNLWSVVRRGARPECDARHSRKPRHVQNLREIHPAESRLNDLRLVR